jgi:hypothetical protein
MYKDYNPILNQYKLGRKYYPKEYQKIVEGIASTKILILCIAKP